MSMRRLALLGSKSGAWISILGMPNPHLRICESAGSPVNVAVVLQDDSVDEMLFVGDGEYPIGEASWVRVSCGKGNTKMICDIVSRRRVA